MLMITVMAFATDYKGQLDFAIKIKSDSYPASIAEGTLSIRQYANGNYQVTAKDFNIPDVGNFGDVVCDGLPGTTDANGVTTINVTDCNAGLDDGSSWTDLSSTKLLVKFNEEKAYATFEGQYQVGITRTVSYTFGVDDFESTGGGEPGGEDKPAIVDVVDADYAPNGTKFAFPFTINWETQKLVAKLDLSTCSRYTHNEDTITVGTNNGHGDVSLWNPNNGEANCHLYYTRYNYGTDEKVLNLHYLEKPSDEVIRVDKSIQNLEPGLVVFTFDKDGLHVGDNLIATPAEMTTLYNSTSLIFGSKEGASLATLLTNTLRLFLLTGQSQKRSTLLTSTRALKVPIVAVSSTASLSSRQARTSRQRTLRLQRLLTRIIQQTNRSQLRQAAS